MSRLIGALALLWAVTPQAHAGIVDDLFAGKGAPESSEVFKYDLDRVAYVPGYSVQLFREGRYLGRFAWATPSDCEPFLNQPIPA